MFKVVKIWNHIIIINPKAKKINMVQVRILIWVNKIWCLDSPSEKGLERLLQKLPFLGYSYTLCITSFSFKNISPG